jgi:hypothetical protein
MELARQQQIPDAEEHLKQETLSLGGRVRAWAGEQGALAPLSSLASCCTANGIAKILRQLNCCRKFVKKAMIFLSRAA